MDRTHRFARTVAIGVAGWGVIAVTGCQQLGLTEPDPVEVPCASCHTPDYQATKLPNHTAQSFSTNCVQCHATSAWKPANGFDHGTVFPLTGKHSTATCQECHTTDLPPPKACVGCHEPAYLGAKIPNHVTSKYPTTCEKCHTTSGWKPATGFDHATVFPLLGKHSTTACEKCHTSDLPPPKTCVACHEPDYVGAKLPNHVTGKFAKTCEACHTPAGWKPATGFDHGKVFPLLGKHLTTACEKCHTSDLPPPKTCVACHEPDYLGAKLPDHVAGKYAKTCDTCHTPTGWKPATGFDHAKLFPLLGKHATTPCEKCHTSDLPPPKTCSACHMAEYKATTVPNHATQGFGTTCETCHTPTAWKPAKMPSHTKFPITSGKHSKYTCAQCHQDPTSYKAFTCMSGNCHSKSSTDNKHNGEGGYAYTAAKCYQCHPQGFADD
jgi:hypothetical protein